MVVKFVIFIVLMRVVFIFFFFNIFFSYLFKVVGFFSIIIGSVGALTQQKIKRFVAFTSINQLGLILLGTAFDFLNIFGSLFALIVYILTNIIFFAIILSMREKKQHVFISYLSDLHNFFISSPANTIYLTISILSMSGIPPFLGFFSKYFLLLPILNNDIHNLFWPGFVLFFHVVGTFNYLRLLRNL